MRWCSLDLHHCSDLRWRKTSNVGAGGNCLDSGVDIRVPVWLSKANGEHLLFLLQKLLQLKMFASCIWLLNIITRIITVVVVPAPENVTTGGERTRCRKLPVSGAEMVPNTKPECLLQCCSARQSLDSWTLPVVEHSWVHFWANSPFRICHIMKCVSLHS